MSTIRKQKVFVGMSGGVDSSVTAALLKEAGHDVTGVFVKVWQPDFLECTWKDDRRDAMRVAALLDIPFETIDLEAEYKKEIIDYMIDEYTKGRTPNPDVMCNRYVKFGAFLQYARQHGADAVATGHYARVQAGQNGYQLLKGVDENKDQSYFLWTLTQDVLPHILFPIGEYTKPEVRKRAEEFGLPTAQKKDSQGLCFVGKLDMREFLKHVIDTQSGDVLNIDGEVVGHHEGAALYTIGQRHGFTITKKGTDDAPRYVIDKNVEDNTIVVGEKEQLQTQGARTTVPLSSVNIISAPESAALTARVRYRGELSSCTLEQSDTGTVVVFEKPVVAPVGQSLVLYDGNVCIGGGIIEKSDQTT